MRQELFTDRLTGVSNRSALQHVLAALTAGDAASAQPFALLFMDLNLFKALNDRWGHDNGDRALAEVAQRLRQQVRAADHVARLGGDEFVVVLRGVETPEMARALADKLVATLSAPLTTLEGIPAGETVHLGASVGIALYPADGQDVQTLLRQADQQMYQDKARRSTPAR
jgi:diguanylate cyclase (GGDEF)-like protein